MSESSESFTQLIYSKTLIHSGAEHMNILLNVYIYSILISDVLASDPNVRKIYISTL